jgi:eukaryotic-like serine/threonine-protein kinase
MTQTRTCRVCGSEVDRDAPFGHCPRCLIDHGFLSSEQPDLEPPPPTRRTRLFGDYELLQQLGRGGMGVVFKARQISLNRTVALKMLRDSQLDSPVIVQRFQVEAETVARLDHPNIVPIYEVGEYHGRHFFSMRLIEGDSLDEMISRGVLNLPDATQGRRSANWTAQARIAALVQAVARAVHYAHQHGILHRDLKPSNILLDQHDQPHLTDFGVSKCLDRDFTITGAGEIIGTPAYMAPEQAAAQKVTIAADIYSLGAILYHLLTGRPPFHASSPVSRGNPPRSIASSTKISRLFASSALKRSHTAAMRRPRPSRKTSNGGSGTNPSRRGH